MQNHVAPNAPVWQLQQAPVVDVMRQNPPPAHFTLVQAPNVNAVFKIVVEPAPRLGLVASIIFYVGAPRPFYDPNADEIQICQIWFPNMPPDGAIYKEAIAFAIAHRNESETIG